MSISFSGLASGLDTSTWVEQLVSLKQAKVDSLEEEKKILQQTKEVVSSIRSFFESFRATLNKITDSNLFRGTNLDIFAQNLALSSNASIATAFATAEAKEATYELSVENLATNTQAVSGYRTSITETTIATENSLLKNLGVNAGKIGIRHNGVTQQLSITENDTIASFIEKLNNIGVNASFNNGIFSLELGVSDITENGTNIINALGLKDVNTGYETSSSLFSVTTETVTEFATGDTLLSEFGVSEGDFVYQSGGMYYTVTVDNTTSVDSLVEAINSTGVIASYDETTGEFFMSDVDIVTATIEATITNADGSTTTKTINPTTTNLADKLGLDSETYSTTQSTKKLSYAETITTTATATEGTQLSELGYTVNNGDEIVFTNANNELNTITLNGTSTIGDVLGAFRDAGLHATLKTDGTVEITGGDIVGESSTFDIETAFGLTSNPYSGIVVGDSLNTESETTVNASKTTRLVEDLGATEGWIKVTDSAGNVNYKEITSGLTIKQFAEDLKDVGVSITIDETTGVMTIENGSISTPTASELSAIGGGATASNLVEKLFGDSITVSPSGEVVSTSTKTDALYYKTSVTTKVDEETYLTALEVTTGTVEFTTGDGVKTVDISNDTTINSLRAALASVGISTTWDSENSKLTINDAVISGGTSNFADVFGFETIYEDGYTGSDSLYVNITTSVTATSSTTLGVYGVSSSGETLNVYDSEGELVGTTTITNATDFEDLINFVNTFTSTKGVSAELKNGVLSINDGYIENSTLESALDLEVTSGTSSAIGIAITVTQEGTVNVNTKLGEIISALGTESKVSSGYNLAFNGTTIGVDENTSLAQIMNSISAISTNAEAYLDSSTGRFVVKGGSLTGSVAEALGISTKTSTAGFTATGDTFYTEVVSRANSETTFGELGIESSSFTIFDANGDSVETVTMTGANSIGDFLSTISTLTTEKLTGTIDSNGVLTLSSDEGYYITGDLATALGIGATEITTTISSNQVSTAAITCTQTVIAEETAKLSSLGVTTTDKTLYILDSLGNTISTVTTMDGISDPTLKDLMSVLADHTIQSDYTDGVLTLSSTEGYYATGSILSQLGIEATGKGSVSVTTGQAVTSTVGLIGTTSVYASSTTTISDCVTLPSNKELVINNSSGTAIGTVTVTNTMTFGELTSILGNATTGYGINLNINDGVLSINSSSGNYIAAGDTASALGITINQNTTITTAGLDATLADLNITSYVMKVHEYNGVVEQSYTFNSSTTLQNIKDTLSTHNITMTMDNGVINLTRTNNDSIGDYKYITGSLATALGIGTTLDSTQNVQGYESKGYIEYADVNYIDENTEIEKIINTSLANSGIYEATIGEGGTVYDMADYDTLGDFFEAIESTGKIDASVENGQIKINSLDGTGIYGLEELGINSTTSYTMSKTSDVIIASTETSSYNYYSTSATIDGINSSTKLGDLGTVYDNIIIYDTYTDEEIEITTSESVLLSDIGYGYVDVSVDDYGNITLSSDRYYMKQIPSSMLNSELITSTYMYHPETIVTTTTTTIGLDTTLDEMFNGRHQTVWVKDTETGQEQAIVWSTSTTTFGEFLSSIEQSELSELSVNLTDGRVTINSSDGDYISSMTSDLVDAFGFSSTQDSDIISQSTSIASSYTFSTTINLNATSSTTFDEMYGTSLLFPGGLTSSLNDTGRVIGIQSLETEEIIQTITIEGTDTLESLVTKLNQAGVNASLEEDATGVKISIKDGVNTISNANSSMNSAFFNFFKFDDDDLDTFSSMGTDFPETVNLYTNDPSNQLIVNISNAAISNTITTPPDAINGKLIESSSESVTLDTKLSELGFAGDGTISYFDGTTTQSINVTKDSKISDLAQYGLNVSVDGDGKITLTPDEKGYITNISSNLANTLAIKAPYYTETNEIEFKNTKSKTLSAAGTGTPDYDTKVLDLSGFDFGSEEIAYFDGKSMRTIYVSGENLTISGFVSTINAQTDGNVILSYNNSTGVLNIYGKNNAYIDEIVGGVKFKDAFNLGSINYTTESTTQNSKSNILKANNEIFASLTPESSTSLTALENSSGSGITFTDGAVTLSITTTSTSGVVLNTTLVYTTAASLASVASDLSDLGITMTLNDGKVKFTSDSLSDFTLGGALGDYLKGSSYKINHNVGETVNTSSILGANVQAGLKEGASVTELGLTSGNININKDGNVTTAYFDASTISTADDILDFFSQLGFNASISNGKIKLTSSDGKSLSTPDSDASNVLSKLGLDNWTVFDVGQSSNTILQDNIITTKLTANLAEEKTLLELVDSSGNALFTESELNGWIYKYDNDVSRTSISIAATDTISSLQEKLGNNFSVSITNGKISINAEDGAYLTTDGITGDASTLLSEISINDWTFNSSSTSDSLAINTSQVRKLETISSNKVCLIDLTDATGNSLGITEGEYVIVANGNATTLDITSTTTVDDLIYELNSTGYFNATIKSNGSLAINGIGDSYITVSDSATGSSNIVEKLKLLDNLEVKTAVTTNKLQEESVVTTEKINGDTKLKDIGAYQEGWITVVKDGVSRDISLSTDATIQSFINATGLDGYINDNGQIVFTSDGDDYLKACETAGKTSSNALELLGITQDKWVISNDYDAKLSTTTISTQTVAATRDTALSDLGVTGGEYFIYNNGVKYTAVVSSDDTLGDVIDTLEAFNIQVGLISGADGTKLTLAGMGDTYVAQSNSANASNIVSKLFELSESSTMQNYSGTLELTTTVNTTTLASLTDKISDFTPGYIPSGTLSLTVNGENCSIELSENETFSSLISKLDKIGVNAYITNDGDFVIESGFNELQIDTSQDLFQALGMPATTVNLGGYSRSNNTLIQSVTSTVMLSSANYANGSTQLKDLNISEGTLSVYRDGQRAQITIEANETFDSLESKIQTALGADMQIDFKKPGVDLANNPYQEDGFLRIYSTDPDVEVRLGSTSDSSNFSAITGTITDGNNGVISSRELYRINGESKLTTSGLFRTGDITTGKFTIGDAVFEITNDTTLNDLITMINTTDAANATAYWDSAKGQLVLKAKNSGSSLLNIRAGNENNNSDPVSNITDILGFTVTDENGINKMVTESQQLGQNANFTINGTKFTSTSNTVDSSVSRIEGLTINLKNITPNGETVTITVEKDKDTIANAIEDVIASYNQLMKNVDKQIGMNGALHDESTLKFIRDRIWRLMTSSELGTQVFKNLNAIGITTAEGSVGNISTGDSIMELQFDKEKFFEAYKGDPNAVRELLLGSDKDSNGLIEKGEFGVFNEIESLLNDSVLSAVTGYFDSTERSYSNRINTIDTKIDKALVAMDRYRARLEKKFSSMDLLIGNIQNQYSMFLGAGVA